MRVNTDVGISWGGGGRSWRQIFENTLGMELDIV
jgi:hypothetical protein